MKHFILIIALLSTSTVFAADIKDADLAGTWYPASKTELQSMLQGYIDNANPQKVEDGIFAIISPHAGYQFSGPVAAYSYKALQGRKIDTVIVIGFSHRRFYDGIAVYPSGSFRTPLGISKIDEELARKLIASNTRIKAEKLLFQEENSVEMQIPFIQLTFGDVKIVPVAFGTQDYQDAQILADALAGALKDRRGYIVVASTDLSHYHEYGEATRIDNRLIEAVKSMDAKKFYDGSARGLYELCGLMPVTATLLAAGKLGFNDIAILKYANSGDTYGDKSRVVGYLGAAIYSKDAREAGPQASRRGAGEQNVEGGSKMLNDSQRKRLLTIARESLTSFIKEKKRKDFTESDPVLNREMGAFVTLRENGQLRGCIGNMVGQGPLYKTVADMAIEAAMGDPRFTAVSAAELDKIDIEISALSPMKRVKSADEIKIPGHGVLVKCGFSGGVYLPQVATECGWNKEQFLTSLCGEKAGIRPYAWKDPSTELYVFTAEVFGEKDPAPSHKQDR